MPQRCFGFIVETTDKAIHVRIIEHGVERIETIPLSNPHIEPVAYQPGDTITFWPARMIHGFVRLEDRQKEFDIQAIASWRPRGYEPNGEICRLCEGPVIINAETQHKMCARCTKTQRCE